MYRYIGMKLFTLIYIYHTQTYVCEYVHAYTCIHIYIYVYIYVCTHI